MRGLMQGRDPWLRRNGVRQSLYPGQLSRVNYHSPAIVTWLRYKGPKGLERAISVLWALLGVVVLWCLMRYIYLWSNNTWDIVPIECNFPPPARSDYPQEAVECDPPAPSFFRVMWTGRWPAFWMLVLLVMVAVLKRGFKWLADRIVTVGKARVEAEVAWHTWLLRQRIFSPEGGISSNGRMFITIIFPLDDPTERRVLASVQSQWYWAEVMSPGTTVLLPRAYYSTLDGLPQDGKVVVVQSPTNDLNLPVYNPEDSAYAV
jgi:hypothetical protein